MTKTGRGRPKKYGSKTLTFTVRCPVDLVEWLEAEAKANGKNKNEFVVDALMKAATESGATLISHEDDSDYMAWVDEKNAEAEES